MHILFDSVAAVQAYNFVGLPPNVIQTTGNVSPGDGLAGVYTNNGYTNPGAGGIQSSDGIWWKYAGTAIGAVSSVFGRTGAVIAATNDYGFSQISGNIGVSQMAGGTGASATTHWRGHGTWHASRYRGAPGR